MMDKAKLAQVARTLMFEVDNEVLNQLAIEYEVLNKRISNLHKINVDNVEPLIYVDETPSTSLREDIGSTSLSQQIVLRNAPQASDNYFALPRVIKDPTEQVDQFSNKKREN